ncbi:MAG: hypothetical protein RR968_00540 [Vagococcus sp.]
MTNVYTSSIEIIEYFKDNSIMLYQSNFLTNLDETINLEFEDFVQFVINERLESLFYFTVVIEENDFYIDDTLRQSYELKYRSYIKELIQNFNDSVEIPEDLIGLERLMVIQAMYNGAKVIAIVSFPIAKQLDDSESILENLIGNSLEDGSFIKYHEKILKDKQKNVTVLDDFLKSDSDFKTAKNHTLRAKYLAKLQINRPDIYNLFKSTPFGNNPLGYLDAVYQEFK